MSTRYLLDIYWKSNGLGWEWRKYEENNVTVFNLNCRNRL